MKKSTKYILGGAFLGAAALGVALGMGSANRRAAGPYGYRQLQYDTTDGRRVTVIFDSKVYEALGITQGTVPDSEQQQVSHAVRDYKDGYTWADENAFFLDVNAFLTRGTSLTLVN